MQVVRRHIRNLTLAYSQAFLPQLVVHSAPCPSAHDDLQFGYISLFPLLLRLIPPDSHVLGRQLELMRDPSRIWTQYGLRSLR